MFFRRTISNRIKNFFPIILLVIFLGMTSFSQATITKEISYQGKLTNASNVAVANGDYAMIIRIYDAASGGNCLWSAQGDCGSPEARSVAVANGIFSIMLGETGDNPITLDFNSSYYLGVKVGSDAEMTPRKKIGSAGYAFNADRLDGLDSATSGANAHVVATDASGNLTTTGITYFGGSTYYVNASGTANLAGTTVNGTTLSTGLITGNAGLTITGATVSLNASSNFAVNIATGTSTGTITLGGTGTQSIDIGTGVAAKTITIGNANDDTFSINSSGLDVSTTGALTGISGITNDGAYTQSGTTANTFTGTATFSNATYSALFTGGNVGIGTTNPGAQLHVKASSGQTHLWIDSVVDNYPVLQFRENGTMKWQIFNDFNSDNLEFYPNGGPTKLAITTAGNVGIGTTGPGNTLQIGSMGATGFSGNAFTLGNGTNVLAMNMGAVGYLTSSHALVLGAGSNTTNQLYLQSGGNVGIGMTAPGAKLEINGQIKITGGVPGASKVLTSDANGLATWETAAGGGAPVGASYIVQTDDATLTAEQALGALGTGILKNTTTTGVLSIAVAGDFPTLNQSTTGSAATLTTARTIWGQSFNGSANISGAITGASTISMTGQLTSTLAAGTSPFAVTSTTVNTNLNADLLDGIHSGSFLQGNQTITLSGDVTGSGTTAITTTLATVNSNVGSFGSSTAIPTFTVNAKGLITAASTAVVVAPAGTLSGTTLASGVTASSLTSVGTLGSLAVTGAITWSGGGSANANTAYSHSQDVTGGVHGAVSANTANMLVRRDGSGNFSAGTITGANFQLGTSGYVGLNGGTTYGIGVIANRNSAVFDTVDTVGSDPLQLVYYSTGAGVTVGDSGTDHPLTVYGTVTGGTYNGQTISSAANFTGSLTTATAINTTSGPYQIGGVTRLSYTSSYTTLHDGAGRIAMYIGSADPGNYYDNTTHYFRAIATGTTFATINASGIAANVGSFSGAGTGLTGTASSLSIGGNASTATLASTATIYTGRTDAAWYQAMWATSGGTSLYSTNNVTIRSSAYGGIGFNASAWYIEGNASYGLYSNTGFYAAGGLWDAGNRVYSAANPQVNISGNADTVDSLHASSFSRKDATSQWIKPYYEYGNYLTSESPATLRDQMGGGGLRVDFMHPSYTGSGGWNHVMTWSGYGAYNMYQLGGHYDGGTGTALWVRSEANHQLTGWTAWRRLWDSASDGSGSGLDADTLDGFNSSAFGDATAANQTTILSRIGTSADAASMASTLFAGQQYIADNMRAYYYITASAYNGANASAVCASGYHMCTQTEYVGRTFNTALGADSVMDSYVWVDNNSNHSDGTAGYGDCYNWTTSVSTVAGGILFPNTGSQSYAFCQSTYRVLCCN